MILKMNKLFYLHLIWLVWETVLHDHHYNVWTVWDVVVIRYVVVHVNYLTVTLCHTTDLCFTEPRWVTQCQILLYERDSRVVLWHTQLLQTLSYLIYRNVKRSTHETLVVLLELTLYTLQHFLWYIVVSTHYLLHPLVEVTHRIVLVYLYAPVVQSRILRLLEYQLVISIRLTTYTTYQFLMLWVRIHLPLTTVTELKRHYLYLKTLLLERFKLTTNHIIVTYRCDVCTVLLDVR